MDGRSWSFPRVYRAHGAEYSLRTVAATDGSDPRVFHLHPGLSFEEGPFYLLEEGPFYLATSAACWAQALGITAQDRVAVLGQGLVGNLVMQFARRYRPAQLIAVDALELRCRLAGEVGAPEVVNAAEEDPVAAVKRLTDGAGASIVVDCVGGPAGLASFEQAQRMVSDGGLIQVNAKYHQQPLPLHVDRFQGKRMLVSYPPSTDRVALGKVAMEALAAGEVRVQPLITHRFEGKDLKAAYDFLYHHPEQAMGVLFLWQRRI